MTLANETDPVETVKLILDNAADTEWPSDTPPDRIERQETSEPSQKLNDGRRSDVSIYIGSPASGSFDTFSADADRLDQTEIVRADIWAKDANTTNNYLAEAVRLIFAYADDNQQDTQWTDIEPSENEDLSAQAFYRGSFAVNGLQVTLRRNAAP